MKKLIYFFAAIGVVYCCHFIYSEVQEHQILKSKHINCKKIQIGMSLPTVRKILKDDLEYWGTKDLHGKIEFNTSKDSVPHYFLIYRPYMFAQSEMLTIYFDPITLKVTKVNCGDESINK